MSDLGKLLKDAFMQEASTTRVLKGSARWKHLMIAPGASRARAALRLSEKKGLKGSSKVANDSPRTGGLRGTAGTGCTLIGSQGTDLLSAHENTGSMSVPFARPHTLPQPDPASRPQILSWSKKQYSRPPTSLQWGVQAPSKPASEWSEAWTATIKENAKHPDLKDETTVFLVNPGRFFLATCDVTSPRCTRRAFGLNAKEYYAICEPIKSPPPSREGKLVRRHGPIERTRGKYDSRTCQFGFGIVEHAEKVAEMKSISEQRALAAASYQQNRICLLDVTKRNLRSGAYSPAIALCRQKDMLAEDMNLPDKHKKDGRWTTFLYQTS